MKAMLIIYLVAIKGGGAMSTQKFETVEQCLYARQQVQSLHISEFMSGRTTVKCIKLK